MGNTHGEIGVEFMQHVFLVNVLPVNLPKKHVCDQTNEYIRVCVCECVTHVCVRCVDFDTYTCTPFSSTSNPVVMFMYGQTTNSHWKLCNKHWTMTKIINKHLGLYSLILFIYYNQKLHKHPNKIRNVDSDWIKQKKN